jgi:GxxExxY protein
MGCGFLEAVYQECLEVELAAQGIPFRPQAEIGLAYKGRPLAQTYKADFICFDRIIIEIKAVRAFDDLPRAQLQNYLRATGLKLGLLVNFGHYPKLEYERIVL